MVFEVLTNQILIWDIFGTFLKPSISSEKTKSFTFLSVSFLKALITIDVRKTSPNVPICGKPDGPYPV